MRQVQLACHTPTAALRMKASIVSSSDSTESSVNSSITSLRSSSLRSAAGPSSSLAITSVSSLFLALISPTWRTLSESAGIA